MLLPQSKRAYLRASDQHHFHPNNDQQQRKHPLQVSPCWASYSFFETYFAPQGETRTKNYRIQMVFALTNS
jgi:hypothetical protein